MECSGNIDNALDAIHGAANELDTLIKAGKPLTEGDVTTLNELIDTTRQLRNTAICYYATMFPQERVAKAFNLSTARISQIVNGPFDIDTISSGNAAWVGSDNIGPTKGTEIRLDDVKVESFKLE